MSPDCFLGAFRMVCEYWKDLSSINSFKPDRYRLACCFLSSISISWAALFAVWDVDSIIMVLISGVCKISRFEAVDLCGSSPVCCSGSGSTSSRSLKSPISMWEVEGNASKFMWERCWRSCKTMNSAISDLLDSSIFRASSSFGFCYERSRCLVARTRFFSFSFLFPFWYNRYMHDTRGLIV